jgi:hypothetical protein
VWPRDRRSDEDAPPTRGGSKNMTKMGPFELKM